MADISKKLQNAISSLQNNNTQIASQICDEILRAHPDHKDALHIGALVAKQAGNMSLAENYFKRSLRSSSLQPFVLSNYANLLMNLGRYEEACTYFDKSTKIAGQNKDAWFNWAILLCETKQYDQAIAKITQALKINAKDHRLYVLLGNAHRQLENYESAIDAYEQSLNIKSTDLQALHNKGLTLRLMQKPQQALICYHNLVAMKQDYPELYFNLGCAFYDLDDHEQAAQQLNHAINRKPDYVEAHEALNKLLWESGDTNKFLQSYTECMAKFPNSIPLRYSYAAMLIMAKQREKAEIVLQQAIKELGANHSLLHALAILKDKEKDSKEIYQLLHQALEQQPNNTRYRIDIANCLMQETNYALAIQHLDQALVQNPLNQELWAYKGTCWRLSQNESNLWLNDYKNFIHAELIDVPDGYDNLAHFLSVLRLELKTMHRAKQQPLDQSVNGGTQTVGRLLSQPAKVIRDFRTALENRVSWYLNSLPVDPNHPFLNRNTGNFRFAGSWSVNLQQGGFHTNHVHPEGWLSSCTYINVPNELNSKDPAKAGWVKFGETSLQLGDREQVGREICPTEGLCVLFPSYFWHGTYPFNSDQNRMTIPCDISPIGPPT